MSVKRSRGRPRKPVRKFGRNFRKYSNKWKLTKELNDHGVHFWREKCTKEIVMNPIANTNTVVGNLTFNVKDLLNFWSGGQAGSLAGLFDYYQIRGVQVKFFPMTTLQPPGVTNTAVYNSTQIAIKNDYDSTDSWPSWANALEADAKVKSFNHYPVKHYLKPRIQQYIQSTSIQPSQQVKCFPTRRQNYWLDMRDLDVDHYGLKWAVEHPANPQTVLGSQFSMTVMLTYYVALKGQI